jgi:hypothetical protein
MSDLEGAFLFIRQHRQHQQHIESRRKLCNSNFSIRSLKTACESGVGKARLAGAGLCVGSDKLCSKSELHARMYTPPLQASLVEGRE